MPCICTFYGIRIYMYVDEHRRPHFHVRYQGFSAVFSIATGQLDKGRLPPRATRLVTEWWRRYKMALESNRDRIEAGFQPRSIPPLE